MVGKSRKDIRDVIHDLGKYPPDAFQFVQEGLSYTVRQTHGEMSAAHHAVYQFMHGNELDINQLENLYFNDQLPEDVREAVDEAGGLEKFNRHVSGSNLCWGLRSYAQERWGALASAVLHHWKIRRTRDFGEIIFALVENEYLQKQPQDAITDFDEVYPFKEAFDHAYKIQFDESQN